MQYGGIIYTIFMECYDLKSREISRRPSKDFPSDEIHTFPYFSSPLENDEGVVKGTDVVDLRKELVFIIENADLNNELDYIYTEIACLYVEGNTKFCHRFGDKRVKEILEGKGFKCTYNDNRELVVFWTDLNSGVKTFIKSYIDEHGLNDEQLQHLYNCAVRELKKAAKDKWRSARIAVEKENYEYSIVKRQVEDIFKKAGLKVNVTGFKTVGITISWY